MDQVSRLVNWLGNNAVHQDVNHAAETLTKISPDLLMPDESIEMAFKVERDHFYFTSKRILFRNKKGISGQKVNYKSLPYNTIQAFSVQTAGKLLDTNSELRVWSKGLEYTAMNFAKGEVDIFSLQGYMNAKVLHAGNIGHDAPAEAPFVPPPRTSGASPAEEFANWIGDDASQIDAANVEEHLKQGPPILVADERVEMAFKCFRDSTLLTSKRILLVDVKGLGSSVVEYVSVLWSTLRAFSVETAGSWLDRDAKMTLWTDMRDLSAIKQDLRKGQADIVAIQRFISNKLLGMDTAPPSEKAVVEAPDKKEQDMLAWLGNDMRQIDATVADRQFHDSPPILQGCEHVEMAFKGRKDMTLFTTKRLLVVDYQRGLLSGTKVKYLSVPWKFVQAFGVRSAGAFMDKDSEMMIWTDIMNDPAIGDNPPQPGMSYLEQDFQKDAVDLMAVFRYMSQKCLNSQAPAPPVPVPSSPEDVKIGPPGGVESFLNWLGDDAHQLDPGQVDKQLHEVNPMLQSDEHVVMAFRNRRDMICFTNKRVLIIDAQGWGTKVQYTSVPFSSIRAFAVESAGAWDRDAEVRMYVKAHWLPVIKQDLRKGRADIIAIKNFLAAQVFHASDGTSVVDTGSTSEGAGALDAFLGWIGDDAHKIDAADVNSKFHTTPPILQSDETVDLAFKCGRDLFVLTTKRALIVDVQGFSGKKVAYISVPYKYCDAFAVQSAGQFDWDAEARIYADIPGYHALSQDLSKSKVDIFEIQKMFAAKILNR